MASIQLQILHASDQEGNLPAIQDAVNFSAVVNALETEFANTLILSSGDIYIPGPFFNASDEVFGAAGVGDILINNAFGFQAVAFGNHEFDLGTDTISELLQANAEIDLSSLGFQQFPTYPGTFFPYLSTNIDFSDDENLADLVVPDGQPPQGNSISGSTVLEVGGELIGVVGATTPSLATISSPGDDINIAPADDEDFAALAAEIQNSVDALTATGIDKIILLSHFQQISIDQEVAALLDDVDIVIAGGSNTILANEDDPLRAGDESDGAYPLAVDSNGETVYVVNTDGNYRYVGRLVVDFDDNGVITNIGAESGAFATDDAGVDRVFGTDVDPREEASPAVVAITDAIAENVLDRDGNFFGRTDVFLNGTRSDVRTQETNLGNLTADANLFIAQEYDSSVVVSIKNGGGIRDNIGTATIPPGGTGDDLELSPPAANPLTGKEEGQISQLDIENTLSFNNELSLLTVSAIELKQIIEHSVAATAPGEEPGQFPQVSGISFTFDATQQAISLTTDAEGNVTGVETDGERISSLALVDEAGEVIDTIVADGEIVGDPNREIRLVTLNFLANGGDSYPFPLFGENRVDLVSEPLPEGATNFATFTDNGSEQDALAEFLAANFETTPFDVADVPPTEDQRIVNAIFTQQIGVAPEASESITLSPIGTFETGVFDESAAEITAYDPVSQRLFVVNANSSSIDVLDLSDPSNPSQAFAIDASLFGGVANSVDVSNGIVAVAIGAENDQDPGQVVFFDTDGNFLNSVTVGALPDMLTFTPDGTRVLVANEGEPSEDYLVDPEGSVSIIDLSNGILNLSVTTADFSAFNDDIEELQAAGVRIFGPGATVAQDLEPEFIATSSDSTTAYVALQENNALAVLDIEAGEITDILPLGFKDHSDPANPLDASNEDGVIRITNYPNLFGMFQPDAIETFEIAGETFIITANEGDSRDYDGFSEEARVADLDLDPEAFPNAANLQDDAVLGRLQVTTTLGDADGDGLYEELYTFGGRSFSIWRPTEDGLELVFDSGDQLEQITANLLPEQFNSTNDDNDSFDNRSDDKGPEPEGVTTGVIDGRTYAFIGLERIGGIMVYDVSNPSSPEFVQYINNRDFTGDPEAGTAGDLAPEGLTFIAAADSPTGEPLLVVANEVSGTTTVFAIDVNSSGLSVDTNNIFTLDGDASDAVSLEINFTGVDADFINEIGVYRVVEGQTTSEILNSGEVVFSALNATSIDFLSSQGFSNPSRIISGFQGGDQIGFYLVRNSTTDAVLAGETPESEVVLGDSITLDVADGGGVFNLNFEDGIGSDFDDLQVTLAVTTEVTLGTALQGDIEVIDLTDLPGDSVIASINVTQEAAFNNVGGLYLLESSDGTVLDPVTGGLFAPGDDGYTTAAIANSVVQFSSVNPEPVNLSGGDIFAPYLLANGDKFYSPFLSANADGLDHVRLIGDNIFTFEDLFGIGDGDFNDFSFEVDLTVV